MRRFGYIVVAGLIGGCVSSVPSPASLQDTCPAICAPSLATTRTSTAPTSVVFTNHGGKPLSKTEIREPIEAALPRFTACYEVYLRANPAAQGKTVLRFKINAQGRVTKARTIHDTVGTPVADCVRETMRGLLFPKPRWGGNVWVTYPFVFAAT